MKLPRKGRLTVLRVFIASPSDLLAERKKCRETIDQVNKLKANPMGVHLQSVGWDDVLPDEGRPQDLINREGLENCRVFILMLWKKWGTPTGKYTSGIEEEFEIARKRRATQLRLRPHMLIYFKSLRPEESARPDSELQQVLDFRQRVQSTFLYSNFPDSEALGNLLTGHLCQWLDGYSRRRLLTMLAAAVAGLMLLGVLAVSVVRWSGLVVQEPQKPSATTNPVETTPIGPTGEEPNTTDSQSKTVKNKVPAEQQFWTLLTTAQNLEAYDQDGQAARQYAQAYEAMPGRFQALVDRQLVASAKSHLIKGEFHQAAKEFDEAFVKVRELGKQ